jgi:general secretion pathway protein I
MMRATNKSGFTLIEVLLALSIIAIALTALIKATAQSVMGTERIKEKNISHWVAMQGVTMIQLGLLNVSNNQEVSEVTQMLGQTWYWHAKIQPTAIPNMEQINITVSHHQNGPFGDALIAFRRKP